MRKLRIVIPVLILLTNVLVVFGGCSPNAGPAPTPLVVAPTPAAAVPVPKASVKKGWEEEWEKVVSAAQREGRVVVYTAMTGLPLRAFAQGFQGRYGIGVETVIDSGANKLMPMLRAKLYLADIAQQSSTVLVTVLRPEGALEPLEPVLMLPEVKDPKVWESGEFPWVDPEHTMLTFLHYPGSTFAINTDLVKPGEIKGWRDLLDPKWKGKIIMHDPTIPGPGSSTFAALVHGGIVGADYFRELAKQEPIILRDTRIEVEWVARGKYPVTVFPLVETVLEFRKVGSPIMTVGPVEGAHLSAGTAGLGLLKGAPHPNAAKLFINWLLTKEAQTLVAEAYGAQSRRVDVPTDRIPPEKVRDPAMKYFDSDIVEMKLKMPDYLKLAKEIFGPLMK